MREAINNFLRKKSLKLLLKLRKAPTGSSLEFLIARATTELKGSINFHSMVYIKSFKKNSGCEQTRLTVLV